MELQVSTVENDTKAIREYIANQLKADRENNQLSLFDPRDPFTGRAGKRRPLTGTKKPACGQASYIMAICPNIKNHLLCGWFLLPVKALYAII